MHNRRRGIAVATLLATLLVTLPGIAAAERVQNPPDPGIVNPVPEPGAVVGVGIHRVTAAVHATRGIANVTLTVDNGDVPVAFDDTATATIVSADVSLDAGEHLLRMSLWADNGASTVRTWRVTAVDLGVERLAGVDRYATAATISGSRFEDLSATAAVLATGEAFADALAAAPVAAKVGGPLLLTRKASLPSVTQRELERVLLPASTVYLLGGVAAIEEGVADRLRELGYRVERVSGATRYETAVAAARLLPDASMAFVASGASFPDALAAASPAARDGMPILLTSKDVLEPGVRSYLQSQGITQVFIAGGEAVVGNAVRDAIRDLGISVVRLAGANRYETAQRVAERFYGTTLTSVALTSGLSFPDGLAGGPHAAAEGLPVLLTPPTHLADGLRTIARSRPMERIVVLGGEAAVHDRVLGDYRRAEVDRGGPALLRTNLEENMELSSFETIEFEFDRELDVANSTVYVTVEGHEVFGTVAPGDFTSTLVFSSETVPLRLEAGAAYPVAVVVRATEGGRTHHHRIELSYRRQDIGLGDFGHTVRDYQERLLALGYWIDEADGVYGRLTSQAIMAFQKAEGLSPSGNIDAATRERLKVAARQEPRHFTSGRSLEIDLNRQIMMFVDRGHVEWVMNTSTGNGEYYYVDGQKRGPALTPRGTFRVERQIDGMRESDLGKLWRPKYFYGGFALHGSTSVPNYAASHGCTRLTYPAMDFVWSAGLAPIGTPVFVYGIAPGTEHRYR